jgi:muramoyltetrapeptide carboxypeptidase
MEKMTRMSILITALCWSMATVAMTPLKRLPWLQKGDTIAILSPGGWVQQKVVDGGANTLRLWGFTPVAAANATKEWHGLGGTIEQRKEDLLWALRSPGIKAIMPTRGGDGTPHLLCEIPLDTLRRYPKWIIGFSDITALLSAEACAGYQSIHGSMCEAIARYNGTDTVSQAVLGMLTGRLPHYKVKPHPLNQRGRARGMLLGGNMSVYGGLAGSEYDFLKYIEKEDCILFIEDLGESIARVDRMLHLQELRGLLSRLTGIICGTFTKYTHPDIGYSDMYEMLHQYLQRYPIPVCYDFPVGHAHLQNFPMLVGSEVTFIVDDEGTELKFH